MLYPQNYPKHAPGWNGKGGYHVVMDAYYDRLMAHIAAVQEAGRELGLSEDILAVHDLSKFSHEEFLGYAYHFHGGGSPDGFSKAWLHHIHHNPHHWQSWIYPDGFHMDGSGMEGNIVQMPPWNALEMIADWMGASKVYSGTDDMSDWLTGNMRKISLHSSTARYVRGILEGLGYEEIVNTRTFKHESIVVTSATNSG